ncbi:MAG: hypothetical protein KAR06_03835 [Deltaproteobacteria bacterium]|nr:hypothetical protein [Deltaproteobacteria bacterium]
MKKGSRQTEAQKTLEQRQVAELKKLESIEAGKKIAAGRRTRGRASLIAGSERGIGGDPLFGQKNLATKERLGVEATEKAAVAAEALVLEKKRKATLDAQLGRDV